VTRLFIIIGVVATQLVLFAVTTTIGYRKANARFTVTVTGAPNETFPLIVITHDREGRAHAIALRYHELASFRAANPDVSFVIPAGDEDRLRAEVEGATQAHGRSDARLAFATFKTRMREGGVQEVEAFATGDDDYENRGWYEAHGATVRPLRHRFYFGPGVGMALAPFCGVGFVVNILSWVAARFVYRSWKARHAG
jgi:hypothetical protein